MVNNADAIGLAIATVLENADAIALIYCVGSGKHRHCCSYLLRRFWKMPMLLLLYIASVLENADAIVLTNCVGCLNNRRLKYFFVKKIIFVFL